MFTGVLSPFLPLVSPRLFFFLREFFSRSLLSERLEQAKTKAEKTSSPSSGRAHHFGHTEERKKNKGLLFLFEEGSELFIIDNSRTNPLSLYSPLGNGQNPPRDSSTFLTTPQNWSGSILGCGQKCARIPGWVWPFPKGGYRERGLVLELSIINYLVSANYKEFRREQSLSSNFITDRAFLSI